MSGAACRENSGTSSFVRDGDGRVRLAWRILLFFGLFVTVALALAVASAPVGLPDIQRSALVTLSASLLAGWALLAVDGRKPGALGFYLHRDGVKESAAGMGLGVGVALAGVAVMAGLGGLRWSWGGGGSPGELVRVGGGALLLFAVPAAAEEALFRGYPLQALAEKWGPGVALLATSAAFGAVHLDNPEISLVGAVNIVLAGVFLGALYLRTGSLWWAWGAHLGWNWALGFAADVPVSGLELIDTPYIRSLETGPSWLSGAGFGPEGSVAVAVVLAATAAWVWRWGGFGPGAGARQARGLAIPVGGPVGQTDGSDPPSG